MIKKKGFSLIEILVSLVIISMVYAYVSSLYITIGQQNKNNTFYLNIINLAQQKLANINIEYTGASLDLIDNKKEIVVIKDSEYDLEWSVYKIEDYLDDEIRDLKINIEWHKSNGDTANYSYTKRIAFGFETGNTDNSIFNMDNINQMDNSAYIYFEPSMGYKKGAFVIYNNELFKATSIHSVGNGSQRDITAPSSDQSSGWESYGTLDNIDLSNPDLEDLIRS